MSRRPRRCAPTTHTVTTPRTIHHPTTWQNSATSRPPIPWHNRQTTPPTIWLGQTSSAHPPCPVRTTCLNTTPTTRNTRSPYLRFFRLRLSFKMTFEISVRKEKLKNVNSRYCSRRNCSRILNSKLNQIWSESVIETRKWISFTYWKSMNCLVMETVEKYETASSSAANYRFLQSGAVKKPKKPCAVAATARRLFTKCAVFVKFPIGENIYSM